MRWFLLTLLFAVVAHAAAPSIEDAYVPQPPPGQTMAVLYLTVRNPFEQPLTLVSADCTVAAKVELHEHVHAGGQMKMRALAKVALPGKSATAFAPGGLHLMLFGLKRPLKAGDEVPFGLTLSDGTRLSALARVRDVRR